MQNFPESSLSKLFISYMSPAESNLILLYKNNSFRKATMVNTFIYNALHPEQSIDTTYEYATIENQWEHGTWAYCNDTFILSSEQGVDVFLSRNDNDIWLDQSIRYFDVSNQKLHEIVLFFYNQVSNRWIMDQNSRLKRIRVNSHGFGKVNFKVKAEDSLAF